MVRSLKKGTTGIELNYKNQTDSINAKNTTIEIVDAVAIVRMILEPCGSNQIDDANDYMDGFHGNPKSIEIWDKHIKTNLEKFLQAYRSNYTSFKLEIKYKKLISYAVDIKFIEEEIISFEMIRNNEGK